MTNAVQVIIPEREQHPVPAYPVEGFRSIWGPCSPLPDDVIGGVPALGGSKFRGRFKHVSALTKRPMLKTAAPWLTLGCPGGCKVLFHLEPSVVSALFLDPYLSVGHGNIARGILDHLCRDLGYGGLNEPIWEWLGYSSAAANAQYPKNTRINMRPNRDHPPNACLSSCGAMKEAINVEKLIPIHT